ncbi:GDSL esterase/lipase At3g48460-like [Andrographis paniculata]|uniref:GDSL esterase/lipase At3g48460-like n=1 Tax=Andrographis paniculata TaxID=175694 RepID=UPI0021E8E7E5|nr:GDSL esterase/lipase At3g48460-like [Andrographis paniculata]
MATPISRLFILTLILCSSCINYVAPAPHRHRPFDAIYAFGDSYTDTGNTQSNTGPSGFMFVSNNPYGSTFFHRPTNRYSDGRLVIDFVADALSLPFLPPYLSRPSPESSVNFAVAGATAIIHSFFAKNNMTLNITPQSIRTELGWFDQVAEERGCRDAAATAAACRKMFEEALIWVGEIGANDYAYSFASAVPPETVQKLAVNSVATFLQALLEKGAKYIVVQGLPPTGCLTLSLYLAPSNDRDAMGCVASANKQSYTHNLALKAKLDVFRKQFPQSTIVYADYYNAYLAVLKNPGKYGIKEIFKVCCGYNGDLYNFNYMYACGSPSASACANPSQYINWDGVHLTEAMYKAVADAFWNGSYAQPSITHLLSKKLQSG